MVYDRGVLLLLCLLICTSVLSLRIGVDSVLRLVCLCYCIITMIMLYNNNNNTIVLYIYI